MEQCKVCGQTIVPAYGNPNAEVLIAGDIPSEVDFKRGVPFVGEGGEVLEYELMKAGLDLWSCRITNLWGHLPNKNSDCQEQFMKDLFFEMAGRKCLLLGPEFAKLFLDGGISDYSGLVITNPIFPRSTQWVMVGVNPAIALHQCAGEIRNVCQKFVKKIKEDKVG